MAVLFPYQDLNAQNGVESAVVVVETSSSAVIADDANMMGAADGMLSDNFGSDSMINSGVSSSSNNGGDLDLEATNNDEIPNVDDGSEEFANNDEETTIEEVVEPDELQHESFINSSSGDPKSAAQETASESGTVTPAAAATIEDEFIDKSPTHHSLFDHDNSPTISGVSSPTNTAIASPTAPKATTTTTNTENNEGDCRLLLHQADVDSNGVLDSSEYMSFLKNLEEKQLLLKEEPLLITTYVDDQYVDLSYQLKMNFVHLSCVCPPATNDDCCAERSGIYISAGMEGEMLDRVCIETVGAIMEELGGGEIGS